MGMEGLAGTAEAPGVEPEGPAVPVSKQAPAAAVTMGILLVEEAVEAAATDAATATAMAPTVKSSFRGKDRAD
jgi:hypothetical protein